MFRLGLFRIRAFTAGSIASLLASLGRGGLMFMLIIWLQGIWLPLHGYSFSETPLWAGIYMLPLTVGFLVAGPASGWLSDRFGARPFATGGMLLAALAFFLLELLPVNFQYWMFAALLLLIGLAMGLFASPNQTGIMNSLPPHRRGVGAGMSATFQNSAMVLSIGVFFTLMVVGLAASLPATLSHGSIAQGVPAADAHRVAHLPPVGLLFASFLGLNPIGQLLGPSLHHLPAANATYLTGRSFFPSLMRARSRRASTRRSTSRASRASSQPAPRGCAAAATSTTWSRATRSWPSRSTASWRSRRRATDRLRRVVEPAALGMPAFEGAAAGWVCGAGGVARVDVRGGVGRAGALGVGVLEGPPQLGPGVAARSRSGGTVEQAGEVGLDCPVSGRRQASARLPHAEERPCEVPPISLPLELDAGVPLAQRHADAVPQTHDLGPPTSAVDADRTHRLLGRHLAGLVQGGEVVRRHGWSLAGGVSRVGRGVSQDGAGEHQLSFQPTDKWRLPPTRGNVRPRRRPALRARAASRACS